MLKINIKKATYELCIAMPAIFTVLYCIKGSLANKAAIVLMSLAYILLNSYYMRYGKKLKFFFFNYLTIIYIIYIGVICGATEIISSFFYGYLLTFIMMLICVEDELREGFIEYFLSRKKYLKCMLLFFVWRLFFSYLS